MKSSKAASRRYRFYKSVTARPTAWSASVLLPLLIAVSTSRAARPEDFGRAQLGEIWTGLWKSGHPEIREPKVENLSESEVLREMMGNWTVMFGVIPDKLTISLTPNRLAEVSGRKDGKNWTKTGAWRVVSDKLVLFLEQDDLPTFIFRTQDHTYVFDPWARTMMSEMKQEK